MGGRSFVPISQTGAGWKANAVARDSKGRLLAVGGAGTDFVVARYLSNGQLDPSFGTNGGVVRLGPFFSPANKQDAAAQDVALDREGRILLAGQANIEAEPLLAMARVTPDGEPDPSFGGGDGLFHSETPSEFPFAVALQPNQRILVSGYVPISEGRTAAFLQRYKPNGRIDHSFGGRGTGKIRLAPPNGGAGILDLSALPSGKILGSGYFGYDFMLARFLSNGKIDPTFGGRRRPGLAITDVARNPNCGCAIGWGLARDRRGRILTAGYVESPNPRTYSALTRHLPNGARDRSFGVNGVARTKVAGGFVSTHVAVQRDGRVVLSGGSGKLGPDGTPFGQSTLLRYRQSGRLDRSFFGDGVLNVKVGSRSLFRDLLVDPSGRIVAAGGAAIGSDRGFLLARFLTR
ncbi:MAG: delta-60 repeat domain-containing protein [Solirubrobacterales bacterium]